FHTPNLESDKMPEPGEIAAKVCGKKHFKTSVSDAEIEPKKKKQAHNDNTLKVTSKKKALVAAKKKAATKLESKALKS
ncbi:hypothetical protein C0993_000636, partial [Termitomyces sp. T159_Od127]